MVAPLAQAVELNSGTVLNTTLSNSSMTFFELNVSVSAYNISTHNILLYHLSYINGNLQVINSSVANWSSVNTHFASSGFPHLGSVSAQSVNLINSFGSDLNATIVFPLGGGRICDDLDYISYNSAGGALTYSPAYTCTSNTVTIVGLLMEDGGGNNLLTLVFGNEPCSTFTRTGFALILIIASIMIISYLAYSVYEDGWETLTWQKVLWMSVVVIVCVIMWQASAQNLGGTCQVG